MIKVPSRASPSHPGEMLLREFLTPLGISQRALAKRIGIPLQRVNALTGGRSGVTPELALRLARVFGTTSGFWTNHQLRWDLFHARRETADVLDRIRPIHGEGSRGVG